MHIKLPLDEFKANFESIARINQDFVMTQQHSLAIWNIFAYLETLATTNELIEFSLLLNKGDI
ncbi:hypothetical protein WA1_28975 [Scytonema hofmannii PCC 7110]|uniref:Uncharacterized protein n=1 Tax=Scytonema hofmannii PCC 7110 TaxID=128403 RepID=A0A139X5N6_9CYAN|nr:hypothetical protein WA1_28975 [Scytonema hofmannii PCC 7110]